MALSDIFSRFGYMPAAQNAQSLMAQYGIGDPYGYRQDSGGSSPYGYPSGDSGAAPDTGTGRVSGGDGLNRVGGWAGRQGYEGAALNSLYTNPSYVLPDVIGNRAAQGPMGAQMANLPYDPNSIYMLTAGNKRSSMKAGAEGYANYLGKDFYPDMAQGQAPASFAKLMGSLTDPRNNSALGMAFEGQTPAGQANLFQKYLYDAALATLGPDVANAIIGAGSEAAMLAGNRALGAGPHSNFNVPRRMGRALGF